MRLVNYYLLTPRGAKREMKALVEAYGEGFPDDRQPRADGETDGQQKGNVHSGELELDPKVIAGETV